MTVQLWFWIFHFLNITKLRYSLTLNFKSNYDLAVLKMKENKHRVYSFKWHLWESTLAKKVRKYENYYKTLERRKNRGVLWASLESDFNRFPDFFFLSALTKMELSKVFSTHIFHWNLGENWHFQIIWYLLLSLYFINKGINWLPHTRWFCFKSCQFLNVSYVMQKMSSRI